jgi:hypothetical protein
LIGNAAQIADANNRIGGNSQSIQNVANSFNDYQGSQVRFQVETEYTGEV